MTELASGEISDVEIENSNDDEGDEQRQISDSDSNSESDSDNSDEDDINNADSDDDDEVDVQRDEEAYNNGFIMDEDLYGSDIDIEGGEGSASDGDEGNDSQSSSDEEGTDPYFLPPPKTSTNALISRRGEKVNQFQGTKADIKRLIDKLKGQIRTSRVLLVDQNVDSC